MSWFLSYIGSTWALILVVVLAVVALGAVAWFARNWKVAVAAVAILVAGLAYQQIDKAAYQRAVNEQKAREFRILQDRIGVLLTIGTADAKRAEAAEATIKDLREHASVTPANDAACLPDDAAKRIGDVK